MRIAFREAVMETEPVVFYGFKSFFSVCPLANRFPAHYVLLFILGFMNSC